MRLSSSRSIEYLGFALAHFLGVLYLLMIPYAVSKQGDFVHLWIGGRAVVLGGGASLYDPATHLAILQSTGYSLSLFWAASNDVLGAFYYPPTAVLWYGFLALFPLVTAQAIQASITWILVIMCGALISEISAKRISTSWAIALLFLSPAVFDSFALGQNGVMTLSIVLLSLWLERKGKFCSAGIALSALVYKPNWLLAFGWYPLVRANFRHAIGIMLGAAAIITASALVVGLEPFSRFFALLRPLWSLHEFSGYSATTQFSVAALYRVLFLNPTVALGAFVLTALLGLAVSAYALRRLPPSRACSGLAAALLLATASLVNPHVHHYDLVLSWAAFVLTLACAKECLKLHHKVTFSLIAAWGLSFYTGIVGGVPLVSVAMVLSVFALALSLLQQRPTGRAPCPHGAD